MARTLFRSDYLNGKPAWIDWIILAVLLVIAFGMIFTDGKMIVVVVSAIGAIGFGTFLIASELGHLNR